MTIYVVTALGGYAKTRVTTHDDAASAKAWLEAQPAGAWGIVVEGPLDIGLRGPAMVDLYNGITGEQVKKFSDRSTGQTRIFQAIEDKFRNQPHEPAVTAQPVGVSKDEPQTEAAAPASEEPENEDMAGKKKTEKKTDAKRKSRGAGIAAGKVADFKQIKAGTDRAKVLKMMNGKHAASAIAASLECEERKIWTILHCLARDCAIGYGIDENGKLTAAYPGSKTYEDAIKSAKE